MRHYRRILLAVLGFACTAIETSAETYPSRPISMIVPFAAGAPVDTVGRVIAERMRQSLGQPIILENVSGAAGGIAVVRAARAPPDGYTLSLGNISSHVLNGAISAQPFDALGEFEPVALLASNPQLILSKNAVPASDLKGLIAWLKANPGKASAGTGGTGGVSHVGGAFFQKETGTQFQFVPYRGTNLAQQDLIGGQIDLLFDQAVSALTNVRAGKMRAYAVTAKARLASAPEIPTVDEAGLPGILHVGLERHLGAQRHTQGNCRQTQRRRDAGAPRSRRPKTPRRVGPRRSASQPADARSAACLPQGRDREMVADH